MNRQSYINAIEGLLSGLAYRIEVRVKLNILDLNLHSENFYTHFLNLLFGWELTNLNTIYQSAESIDLVDDVNKIIAQVSSTAKKGKIDSALSKKSLSKYCEYRFKFISISKDGDELRRKDYSIPNNLIFSPKQDIIDIPSLLREVNGLGIDRMKGILEFLEKEIKPEPDPTKVESNLTEVIKILSKEDLALQETDWEKIAFEIEEKISFNQLNRARDLVTDYAIYQSRIDKIYKDFDLAGANKSLSVLNRIRSEYKQLNASNPDDRFFEIIDKVVNLIRSSSNYTKMPDEELRLCVEILVVDAFIRCKIFENPMRDTNVDSR
jgi:hypothetical protein